MLLQRVITAIVLLALLLPAIFVRSPLPWGILTLAFLGVAAWEWVRLLPGKQPAVGAALLVIGIGTLALFARPSAGWPPLVIVSLCAALVLFWVFAGARRLRAHDSRAGGWLLAGLLLIGCWLALYELRVLGPVPLLSSMAVIWVADIAAYFFGRALGKHKLAPGISPGKSWEGAIGGCASVVLIGLLSARFNLLADSLSATLLGGLGLAASALVLVAIAALSIVGDLHESLLKRQAGVKDSGWILPGHGGVLDRIDALIPTMPAVLLFYQLLR